MDLIDRYVWAVRIFLPKEQRDDIIRELSDDLRSQGVDKEAELGRPLGDEEQVSLLRHYGHPLLIAARYRPQQHLIGPVVYPYYWLALSSSVISSLRSWLPSSGEAHRPPSSVWLSRRLFGTS